MDSYDPLTSIQSGNLTSEEMADINRLALIIPRDTTEETPTGILKIPPIDPKIMKVTPDLESLLHHFSQHGAEVQSMLGEWQSVRPSVPNKLQKKIGLAMYNLWESTDLSNEWETLSPFFRIFNSMGQNFKAIKASCVASPTNFDDLHKHMDKAFATILDKLTKESDSIKKECTPSYSVSTAMIVVLWLNGKPLKVDMGVNPVSITINRDDRPEDVHTFAAFLGGLKLLDPWMIRAMNGSALDPLYEKMKKSKAWNQDVDGVVKAYLTDIRGYLF